MDKIKDQSVEKEETYSAEEKQEMAVPAEEPDLMGRWVLRGKKFLLFFLRPLWRALSLCLAPLWKPFQKGADKITRREWVLFLGMAASIVLLVAAPVLLMKMQNTHKAKDRLYSLFAGERYYWENPKFEINKEELVQCSDNSGNQLNVNGQPFYYEDRDIMFWPFYGIWYPLENTRCYRIEKFSEIKYEYGTGCTTQLPDGSERVLSGFLYDNQDTYVFLENVTLSYNGESRELTPLSYVRAHGNGSMDLYLYGQEEGEIIALETEPEIRFGNGAKIDLNGDMMFYPNGVWRMLYLVVEYIDPLDSD